MPQDVRIPGLDLRGLICPLPLIRLGEFMAALQPGERCRVLADDPGFADDLPDWCQVTGQQLLQLEPQRSGEIWAVVEKRR